LGWIPKEKRNEFLESHYAAERSNSAADTHNTSEVSVSHDNSHHHIPNDARESKNAKKSEPSRSSSMPKVDSYSATLHLLF
jgi:hypothetical protein